MIYHDEESLDVYLEGGAGKLSIDIFGLEWLDEKTFSKVLKALKKKDRNYAKVLEKKLGISLSFSLGYYEVRETIFPANRKCFAYGSVIKEEVPKSAEDSSGLEISAESDERLVMTDGPYGSLLTTKTQEVYLDWLNAVVFKSTLFLITCSIGLVAPVAVWIAPNKIVCTWIFGGMMIVFLLAFFWAYQHGKQFDEIGDL